MALSNFLRLSTARSAPSWPAGVLMITCMTQLMGQQTPSDGSIAQAGWLGRPPALRALHSSTAALINKTFALCPYAHFHMRRSGSDRTGARLVYATAEA